ncbi:MAG: hypothetical protein IJ306_10920 [Oscillospiraceae bacterium]|nr:hypothetical protein [Oscillospiraceae bacterium]
MNWENLNRYYEKIYKIAVDIWRDALRYIPDAKLSWYNLHNVKRNGKFEVEFMPFPEVELDFPEKHIDFGVSFMGEVWAEVTFDREYALEHIDFRNIAENREIEVYGAENYTEDFYCEGMDIDALKEKIKASKEEKIAVYFPPTEDGKDLIEYVIKKL